MPYPIAFDLFYKTLIWIGVYHCDYNAIGSVDDSWEKEILPTNLSIKCIVVGFFID